MKIIKRYANRKLYDSERGCYITLSEIIDLIYRGKEFQVIHHYTKVDMTKSIIAKCIAYKAEKYSIKELIDFLYAK